MGIQVVGYPGDWQTALSWAFAVSRFSGMGKHCSLRSRWFHGPEQPEPVLFTSAEISVTAPDAGIMHGFFHQFFSIIKTSLNGIGFYDN